MSTVLKLIGGVETVLLALVVVTLTTWTLIVYSWVQDVLDSRFGAQEPKIEKTVPCTGCQTNHFHTDAQVDGTSESHCVQGPVNYYITYKCSFFKRTVTSTPKVREHFLVDTDNQEGVDVSLGFPPTSMSETSYKRCTSLKSEKGESSGTSFEILSLSEIAS